jgi:sphinganine-1-phosphate aldolase
MTLGRLTERFQTILNYGNNNDSGNFPPVYVILTTIVSIVAIKILTNEFKNPFQRHLGETWRDRWGSLALQLPPIKRVYDREIEDILNGFKESVSKKWEPFKPFQTVLPEKGWSGEKLLDWLMKIQKVTLGKIENENISGTIYSPVSDQSNKFYEDIKTELNSIEKDFTKDGDYFYNLSKKLSLLFIASSAISSWWNLLHHSEFPLGSCLNYQVVRMVGEMFGGKQDEIMGTHTSGGTESLMLAIRAYRNWGMETRRHQPGESVVIASKSVHAAVLKAGIAYSVKIVLIKEDLDGKMNRDKLERVLRDYGDNVVAIVASAPCYSIGVVDPIIQISKLAEFYKCGLHVDCCLGAFVINNLSEFKTDYLTLSGVTSLSADTHKNGLAPKGSSVIVTKPLFGPNLMEWSFYSFPDWEGGPYGSPKDAGSEPCTPVLNTYLTLLAVGREGYQRSALLIRQMTKDLANVIRSFPGQLSLVAEPELNVIAIRLDPAFGIIEGGIYVFTEEMAKRHFTLNNIKGERAHLCTTLRLACTPNIINDFKKAVEESLKALKKSNDLLKSEGKKFSEKAGIYCSLEAASHPKMAGMTFFRFLQNIILGRKAAKAAVNSYLLALQNPPS